MAFITATLPFSVSDTLTVLAMAQALDISAVISQDVVGSWPLGRDRGTSLWGGSWLERMWQHLHSPPHS